MATPASPGGADAPSVGGSASTDPYGLVTSLLEATALYLDGAVQLQVPHATLDAASQAAVSAFATVSAVAGGSQAAAGEADVERLPGSSESRDGASSATNAVATTAHMRSSRVSVSVEVATSLLA